MLLSQAGRTASGLPCTHLAFEGESHGFHRTEIRTAELPLVTIIADLDRRERAAGAIVGSAVGDALGAPGTPLLCMPPGIW
ncbi:hypothetical protein [Herbidospora yilanensis]|uniref:hypothetical protein n=1 Tax=Herbidospora yilanensis TaxID=354426 RepID=UPI0007849386|nr:hypothetical protein [Herbidospora yilanensis]